MPPLRHSVRLCLLRIVPEFEEAHKSVVGQNADSEPRARRAMVCGWSFRCRLRGLFNCPYLTVKYASECASLYCEESTVTSKAK